MNFIVLSVIIEKNLIELISSDFRRFYYKPEIGFKASVYSCGDKVVYRDGVLKIITCGEV